MEQHRRLEETRAEVESSIPHTWRRARVARRDLDRFVFEPEDIVVAVGQDGLMADCAKYLTGQLVVGINPDVEQNLGILVPHEPRAAGELLAACATGRPEIENRTMVHAALDDGQELNALNEIFVGHWTHQSARYRLRWRDRAERQSSSGLIVSSGTGATGWALSLHRQRNNRVELPAPAERRLVFMVREAFPSVASRAELTDGVLAEGETLEVVSEMNEEGGDLRRWDRGRSAPVSLGTDRAHRPLRSLPAPGAGLASARRPPWRCPMPPRCASSNPGPLPPASVLLHGHGVRPGSHLQRPSLLAGAGRPLTRLARGRPRLVLTPSRDPGMITAVLTLLQSAPRSPVLSHLREDSTS